MNLVLKKGATQQEIDRLEELLFYGTKNIGFDADKYNGILNIQEDPMGIQKRLRDEWERDIS